MLEIEYIPLKTPDGATCGHACVRAGSVELRLRRPVSGAALVVTESGVFSGPQGKRLPVSAQVSAVALHENGRLSCCGFSRTTAMNAADLRRRVAAETPPAPQKPPEPARPAPLPAALAEEIASAIPMTAPEPAPAPKPAAPEPSPPPEAPEPAAMEAIACEAMAARANRVFSRIDTPHSAAPEPEAVPAPAEMPPAPALSAAEQWARDADALIAPAPAEPESAPVPNPFPHIFPGAQFTRGTDGALSGLWPRGNAIAEISAVPGPYSPQPPAELTGYTRYIRARSGGYWVRVIDG